MKPLYIVLLMLSCLKLCSPSSLATTEKNNGDLEEKELKNQKRDVMKDMIFGFVKEKLLQHSQALEHIVKVVENTQELVIKLFDLIQCSYSQSRSAEPKDNDKIEVDSADSQSNVDDTEPLKAFGENMRRYGSLMKNLILREIQDVPEPLVLIEH